MKILFVTPFFPGKATAIKNLMREMIKGLAVRNEVYLVSRIEPEERGSVNEIAQHCTILALSEYATPQKRSPLALLAIIGSYLNLALVARKIIRNRPVDIIQVTYTDLGLFLHKTGIIRAPMVLDTQDVNALLTYRDFSTATGHLRKVLLYCLHIARKHVERFILKRFDLITTRSAYDRDAIRTILARMNRSVPVIDVRHPIDVPLHAPVQRALRRPNSLLFVGALNREWNVRYVLYFMDTILPLIRSKLPGATLTVVGGQPPESLAERCRMDPSVELTGFVEDVSPYYNRSMVFVSPILIGGGIIFKNLEAMSYGVPVVTTSWGNEGIGAAPEKDLLIGDTPEVFAGQVVRLIEDGDLYDAIAENAIRFVRRNYSKDTIIMSLESAYARLIGGTLKNEAACP